MGKRMFVVVLVALFICTSACVQAAQGNGHAEDLMNSVSSGDLSNAKEVLRQTGMLDDLKLMLANSGQLDAAREMYQQSNIPGGKGLEKDVPYSSLEMTKRQFRAAANHGLIGADGEEIDAPQKPLLGRLNRRSPYVQLFFAISLVLFFLFLPYRQLRKSLKHLLGVGRKRIRRKKTF